MKLILSRFRTVRGAVIGRLFQEILDRKGGLIDHERICDTVEREGGNLAPGEYRVEIAKCSFHHRKMLFLHRLQSEISSSSDEAPLSCSSESCSCESSACQSSACQSCACESSACQSCAEERKHHERGHLSALHAVKCPMFQPGNGPFVRAASWWARPVLPASSSTARTPSSSSTTASRRSLPVRAKW